MKKFFTVFLCAVALSACTRYAEGQAYDCGDFTFITVHDRMPVRVDVEIPDSCGAVDVSPHILGVKSERTEGWVSLTLEERGWYVLTPERGRKVFVFAQEACEMPENSVSILDVAALPEGENVTGAVQEAIDANAGRWLVFPERTYLVSGLRIPSGSRIFLGQGAVIKADRDSIYYTSEGTRGFVEILKATDVHICGEGIIDGDGAAVKPFARNRRNLFVSESRNVCIEGIVSLHSASWNTHILGCDSVTVRGVKLLNDWSLKNTDGFDPDCSTDVLIENCFGHCSDDCVAIKTTDRLGQARNLENVTVRGCVFETKKSALKVGTETCAESMSGILFEDNIVVECDRGMSLYVRDGVSMHDVVYRNNRFERNYPEIIQCPYHFYVKKRNPDSKVGEIFDVSLENCIFETEFPNGPRVENPHNAKLEFEIL